ncbi:MAG TPA: alpha/beta hydrolase family protein [Dehalococcoidia bacterium]|nr:alpha/beta hydrolase family protein [Dehalococcoidia bacterium]
MNPYIYPRTKPSFNLHLKETTGKWLRYTVDFPIAKPTRHKENNIAYGEYYQPRGADSWPLAVLVHGWGNRSMIPCKLLAKDLVKKGIASFMLYLVFHSSRMPEVIKNRLPNLSPEEWFEGYQTSVIDVRQIVDWASSTEVIRKQRIAVVGISLGGIISAIAMGVDQRIRVGVILLAGGNYENPAWLRKTGARRTEAESIEARDLYAQYLNRVAVKGLGNVIPPKKSYLTDPLTFASHLRERPLLMVNALWDERVPKQSTVDFWEACGRPDIKWFPTGHSTIWLLYPLIRKEIVAFLCSTFGM